MPPALFLPKLNTTNKKCAVHVSIQRYELARKKGSVQIFSDRLRKTSGITTDANGHNADPTGNYVIIYFFQLTGVKIGNGG